MSKPKQQARNPSLLKYGTAAHDPPPQPTQTLPVTQQDREEAWRFIPSNSIAGQDYAGFLAGKYDEAIAVQAFARHRLAHSPSPSQEVEEMVERLRRIQRDMLETVSGGTGWIDGSEARAFVKRLKAESQELARLAPGDGRTWEDALRYIDNEGPTKEPRDFPTVGYPPPRDPQDDDGNEIINEAFQEGKTRGLWEAADIARRALKADHP